MDDKQLNQSMKGHSICPFALPSGVAVEEWFVGRKKIIENMEKAVVHDRRMSNYHIVGLPRIGKSSILQAFKKRLENREDIKWLIVSYVSLDHCDSAECMWKLIGKTLFKNIKARLQSKDEFMAFKDAMDFEEVDIDSDSYEYVCAVARSLKEAGLHDLILIDEFDNFSTIAQKGTVGQFRTLFNNAEFSINAVLASRRTIERIESEVEGAINTNVSTLAPIFIYGENITPFDQSDMIDYWGHASSRVGGEISDEYKKGVEHYVGTHPFLLNLFNVQYWSTQNSTDYLYNELPLSELNKDFIQTLHNAFELAVWRDVEKWGLLRHLIISTWGPSIEISQDGIIELEKYGIINHNNMITESDGPIMVAISRYFTEWMRIKRYALPFGDEWSKAEGNMRAVVRRFCDEIYDGDEEKMVNHLSTKHIDKEVGIEQKYTAQGRFKSMKSKKDKSINKYPNMSTSIIDYSDPSDLPEIFFKREWDAWFKHVFGGVWADWKDKFNTINEIRNFKYHNNLGFPKSRIDEATRYCHEVNERIENFLNNVHLQSL